MMVLIPWESLIMMRTFDSDIKRNQSSLSWLRNALNVYVHLLDNHFAICKTQSHSCVLVWSLFLLLSEQLEYIFLLFQRYSTSWILNFYLYFLFNIFTLWVNLILNYELINLFCNLYFFKSFIGVFNQITNKI